MVPKSRDRGLNIVHHSHIEAIIKTLRPQKKMLSLYKGAQFSDIPWGKK
jgi:hypothetical protein